MRSTLRPAGRLAVGLAAGLVGLAGLAGCGQRPVASAGPDPSASASPAAPTPSTSATAVAKGDCAFVTGGLPARVVNPPSGKDVPDRGTVTFVVTTNAGKLRLELDRAAAPCAVRSFESLAEQGYFDDTGCHRLITSDPYLLSCGDPMGTGDGGPGYTFADELDRKASYTRGVVAMGNHGPDSNGSQFFLVYADSDLPPHYTIFGSMDADSVAVVKTIAGKGHQDPDPVSPGPAEPAPHGGGEPNYTVRIETVTRR